MNDANIDFEDLAFEFISEFKVRFPELLKNKYGIENLDAEPLDIFNEICVKRGFLMKGGEYDYARCSKAIIDDFRKGRTGKVVLD